MATSKIFGFDNFAYRCGVIDQSRQDMEPSVYITDRNTDQPMVARFGPLLFYDSMPMVRTDISRMSDFIAIYASYLDGQGMFKAEVRPSKRPKELNSKVFSSLSEYVDFIKGGISSYTPSIYNDKLTRIDLMKEDTEYEVVDGNVDFSILDGVWKETKMEFDSVVRASGGKYKWTCRSLVSK
ncbi:MAG: hypothetical protein P0116_13855 [Candidatus Nitrosocosmicus sp.]|nr:hypothetical protein [Candidatus Nitrosocosmicus sp.]